MISNPTDANTNTVKESYFPKVTTQTLGIANERVRDLTGYVLNPQEISTDVVKFLMMYGINEDDIFSVKVGVTKDGELKIIAEVLAKSLKPKKKTQNSWMDFDQDIYDSIVISDDFYNVWRNKIYHGKRKNLKLNQVKRNGEKCIGINIDPTIFLAFVYDINFCDPLYKISAPPKRWKNNKQIEDMSGKERKRYRALQQQYSNYGITQCMVVVTFSNEYQFKDSNGNLISGFHPAEVDAFFEDKDSKK